MKQKFFLFLCCVLSSLTVFSQYPDITTDDTVTVYPVRINHKVGFVEIFPNNKAYEYIAPIYDFIAEVNAAWHTPSPNNKLSPYRIFEIDQKVGLLDEALNTVLPNEFSRIRTLAPNYFAVERDTLFQLIDSTQAVFLAGQTFEDIYLADTIPDQGHYFFVKQNNRWGLSRRDGSVLISPQYFAIEQAGLPGFYKVRREAREYAWELIDSTGQRIVPEGARDFLMLDRTFIAMKGDFYWNTHYINLQPKPGEPIHQTNKVNYLKVEKVSPLLAAFALQGGPTVELWNIIEKKPIKTMKRSRRVQKKGVYFEENRNSTEWIPWWYPLDDQYVIFNAASNGEKEKDYLMDTSGQIKSPVFNYIYTSGKPGVYRVAQKNKWGLYAANIRKGVLIPCDYDGINRFVGDIAFCQQGITTRQRKYGAFSFYGDEIDLLIPNYKRIEQVDARSVFVADKTNEVIFGINDKGKFEIDTIFQNTFSLRLNKNKKRREVKIIPKPGPKEYPLVTEPPGRFTSRKTGPYYAIVETDKEVSGIGAPKEKKVITKLPYSPPKVYQIIKGEMLAIYRKDKAIINPYTRKVYGGSVIPSGFFSLASKSFVEEVPVLGIRPFDRKYMHTTFIGADGRMGLINREGQVMKKDGQPITYTYIGPFREGRARACIGGDLGLIEDKAGRKLEEPSRFLLGKQPDLLREFQMIRGDDAKQTHRSTPQFYISQKKSTAKWVFINIDGEVILDPAADYVLDYDWDEKSALIMRKNGHTDLYGHPDADFGIIDFEGNEIIPTEYDEIGVYSNYFIIGQRGTPTFTFNNKGHQIFVNPTKPSPFKENYSVFRDEEGLWGYIDTAGAIVIPPKYTVARPFSEGLAMVVDSTGNCGFINKQGEKIIQTDIKGRLASFVGDFHEGLCWWSKNNKKWNAYNPSGSKAFDLGALFEYRKIKGKDDVPFTHHTLHALPMDFSGGIAVIQRPDSLTGKPRPAAVSKSGKLIVPAGKYASISSFNALGVAVFSEEKDGLQGLLDTAGQVRLGPTYKHIGSFRQGYAKVLGKNGKFGLINSQGTEVLQTAYSRIGSISEGLVVTQVPGSDQWQFIHIATGRAIGDSYDKTQAFKNGVTFVSNKKKKQIINNLGEEIQLKSGKPQFFSEGVFGVTQTYNEDLAFYADASGNNLFGQYYSEIDTFHLGIAKVRPASMRKRLYGAINMRGVYIVPPKFRFLHPQPDGNIIINPQIFYGLVNKKGKILLEPNYDRIEQLKTPNLFRAERGEEIGYFRVMGDSVKWVWELQN
ncbi:MAG: WG repeat-containing protein [Saprospiraceae bacterium]|nr:WG repeat-containing protein [Saprospiraceae bacterium]